MSYEQRRANLPRCPTCSSPNKSTYWGFCADEACQADRWHKSLPSEAQGAAPQQRNELLERALNLAHEWSAKFPLGGAMDTIAASQVYAAIEELRGARVEPGAQSPQDAHESAESRVIEKLGVSWKRQNSALTVHVYEPNFKVESLVPLDKDYRAHFAMDAAWKKLVEIETRSTPSPDPPKDSDERLRAGGWRTVADSSGTFWVRDNDGRVYTEAEALAAPDSPPQIVSAPELAQKFHEAYERLAPEFGYETRKESAKPWAEVPENNRQLLPAVCREVMRGAADLLDKASAEIHMLERAAESHKYTVSDLVAERDGLREALRGQEPMIGVKELLTLAEEAMKVGAVRYAEAYRIVADRLDSGARLGTESTEPLKYPSMDALMQSVPKARADKKSTEKG